MSQRAHEQRQYYLQTGEVGFAVKRSRVIRVAEVQLGFSLT